MTYISESPYWEGERDYAREAADLQDRYPGPEDDEDEDEVPVREVPEGWGEGVVDRDYAYDPQDRYPVREVPEGWGEGEVDRWN